MHFNDASFPPEYTDPAEKSKNWYGLKMAEAILSYHNSYGNDVFANRSAHHEELREIARGNLDLQRIKNMLGHFADSESADESMAYIDVQVLNLIPKYINLVVGRLNNSRYSTTLTPMDPLSVSAQEEYDAKVKVFQELRGWMEQIGVPAKELFSDIDVDLLVEEPDDILIEGRMNPQMRRAMEGEIAIKIVQEANKWRLKRREAIRDMVVMNHMCIRTFRDKNGKPKMERINPSAFICSNPTNEACENLDFAGHIEYISATQFRREASPFLTEEQIENCISECNVSTPSWRWYSPIPPDDNRAYVPVLRFQFLTENTDTFVKRRNTKGNMKVDRKAFDYSPTPRDEADFEKGFSHGGKDLVHNTYTAKYGGTHVIGTEIVYEYGISNSSRKNNTNLVDEKLDYIAFIPNYDGKESLSLTEQLLEPVMLINLAWNKAKELLADGWMGVREIDFTELEKVAMGKGGTEWSPRQVYEFLVQKRTLIKRKGTNKHDQSNGSAVEINPTGISLADYFSAIGVAIQQIAALTGINELVDGTTPGERTLVGVMDAAQQNTNMALDHYYHALQSVQERVDEAMLAHTQAALREGHTIDHYVRALGIRSVQYMRVSPEIAWASYGIFCEREPDTAAWERMYAIIEKAVALGPDAGGISTADAIFIYMIDNFKQAMQVLAIREEKRRRQAMENKKAETDYLVQEQDKSAERAAASKIQADNNKHKNDLELEQFKQKAAIQLQGHKNVGMVEVARERREGTVEVAQQQGSDRIVQQAQKNVADLEKSKENKVAK